MEKPEIYLWEEKDRFIACYPGNIPAEEKIFITPFFERREPISVEITIRGFDPRYKEEDYFGNTHESIIIHGELKMEGKMYFFTGTGEKTILQGEKLPEAIHWILRLIENYKENKQVGSKRIDTPN